jgi:hypothetical protein
LKHLDKRSGEWKEFYNDARAYHKTAIGSLKRPNLFTPELIQNIAAMGIEKYFMAIFMQKNTLPRNHTMRDLLEESGSFLELPDKLKTTLLYMDSLQSLCSLDNFKITKPSREDAALFIEAIDKVAQLAERELACAQNNNI